MPSYDIEPSLSLAIPKMTGHDTSYTLVAGPQKLGEDSMNGKYSYLESAATLLNQWGSSAGRANFLLSFSWRSSFSPFGYVRFMRNTTEEATDCHFFIP